MGKKERPTEEAGLGTEIEKPEKDPKTFSPGKPEIGVGLKDLINSLPFPVAVVDPADENIVYWSRTARELFGHTAPTTEEWYRIAYPDPGYRRDAIKRWKQILQQARKSGESVNAGEYRVTCSNGSARICELHARFLSSMLIVSFNDITNRHEVITALRASEAKWRSYIERAPFAVLIADREGRYVETNPAASAITGYTEAEILGKHITDFLSPEGRVAGREPFQRLLREGISVGEIPFIHKSGELRVWRISAVALTEDRFLGFVEDISERKKAERRLRESREELFQIIEGSSIATLVINAEHKVTHWNRACEELTGYKAAEMLGTKRQWKAFYRCERPILADIVMNFDPERELDKWYGDRYRKSSLLEGVHEVEDFLPEVGETGKWILFSAIPLRNEQGEVLGAVEMLQDITELKNIQEKYRRSEEFHQSVIRTAPVGIGVVRDRVFQQVNQWFCGMIGYEEEELVGRKARMVYASDADYEEVGIVKYAQIEKSGSGSVETRMQRKDGTVIDVILSSTVLDSEDLSKGVTFTALDITERKQMEKALLQKEEMLTRTERIARVGSWEWDIDPDRVTWSEELFRFFGVDPAEGAPPFAEQAKIYVAEDFEKLEKAVELCRTEGIPYDLQLKTVRADKEIRHCIVSGLAERDPRGEIKRLVGFFQDVTERVAREREREMLQHQLGQARRLASIGRLAGGIAHDFNNMLSVILGNAELAVMDVDKRSSLHNNLREILVAGERSRDVTRQLLAFARKQTISPQNMIVDEVVSGMLKMLKPLIGEDIVLSWIPSEEPWPIRIDPTQLEQAVINLCLNARDAISGQGNITLATRNVTVDEEETVPGIGVAPGDFVLLEASDDGSGMDQETLDSVFEPFFTTKENGKGTGLGMATVYGIVIQSGGFIVPFSEPGRGSTFKLYFPRSKSRSKSRKRAKEITLPLGCSETILLVEDEPAVMTMAGRMLEKQGYRVLSAEGPFSALDLVEAHSGPIDLLLTDVVMPGMNGRELVERIAERNPGIKVIYMSGYTADVIAEQGVIEKGMNFLQKPFSSNDLGQLVRDVLSK